MGSQVFIDPEVLNHDLVVFAAGTQTESVRIRTRELFGGEQITTVPLVKQADQGSNDPISRRRAAQQDLAGGGHPAPSRAPNRRPPRSPAVCPNDTGRSMSRDSASGYDDGAVASWTVRVSPTSRSPTALRLNA